jgi:hypothetical protein
MKSRKFYCFFHFSRVRKTATAVSFRNWKNSMFEFGVAWRLIRILLVVYIAFLWLVRYDFGVRYIYLHFCFSMFSIRSF